MVTTIDRELALLRRMTPAQLRERYLQVFGEPSRSGNKDFLVKRIAWRVQSLAEGGLSERARRRAEELARDADIRTTIPRTAKTSAGATTHTQAVAVSHDPRLPIPGTVLSRQYRGRTVQVRVLSSGFDYEGERYRSLSAIAKAVTGSHWNGHLFFGLRNGKNP